jgi:hypothetical protein
LMLTEYSENIRYIIFIIYKLIQLTNGNSHFKTVSKGFDNRLTINGLSKRHQRFKEP